MVVVIEGGVFGCADRRFVPASGALRSLVERSVEVRVKFLLGLVWVFWGEREGDIWVEEGRLTGERVEVGMESGRISL